MTERRVGRSKRVEDFTKVKVGCGYSGIARTVEHADPSRLVVKGNVPTGEHYVREKPTSLVRDLRLQNRRIAPSDDMAGIVSVEQHRAERVLEVGVGAVIDLQPDRIGQNGNRAGPVCRSSHLASRGSTSGRCRAQGSSGSAIAIQIPSPCP
jgi:hypothetical protein